MPYTVTLRNAGVRMVDDKLFDISVECIINDGTADVISEVITVRYNRNAATLAAYKKDLLDAVKALFDKYKAEQQVARSAAFAGALSDAQSAATTYVNN